MVCSSEKIEREDHYDATNTYRYSIINEHDDRERVIATTDPLGSRTTYQYDANFNPIAKEGPLSSTKWDYDKANRLIKTEEEAKKIREEWLSVFKDIRDGLTAPVSPVIEEILGKPPCRLEDYIVENISL